MKTRGIRNNNPGNIIHSSSRWLGRSILQNDAKFVQFDSMEYGLRALMVLLRNYIHKGFNTPRKIIDRYCPSTQSEGSNESYLNYICHFVDLDDVIEPYSYDFFDLVVGICYFESNYQVRFSQLLIIRRKFNLRK